MQSVIKFWLDTKRVDGFRIDALKHLYERENFENEPLRDAKKKPDEVAYEDLINVHTANLPETFQTLFEWRTLCNEIGERTKRTK